MKKEKLELEYPLKSTSINILWNTIGTPYGLSEWFANDVNVKGEDYIFSWDDYEQIAKRIAVKPQEYIRLQWEDDADTDCYFEMRILKHELSGDLSLMVTEFVEPDDREDEIILWDKHIEDLRSKIGR
ncbi:hypothetical protein D0T49_09820 [Paludibacter sp. 221]|uniref:START-like domain-containing protein n=1 Tax=Paludibacter sp. 221 TaxID=2302939 RepID=UPI0013D173F2|nr:START-like domain-containing protein [Paludibacter sp. 221]NDV47341.1 hypothetical protein [Paludibacter sp. 221]